MQDSCAIYFIRICTDQNCAYVREFHICVYIVYLGIYINTQHTVRLKAFDAAVCTTRPDIRLQTEVPCRTFAAQKPRRLKETAPPHSPEHWELWKCKKACQ